jgi:hypothetical protein
MHGATVKIAYAFRRDHSGWICTDVTCGFAGVNLPGCKVLIGLILL